MTNRVQVHIGIVGYLLFALVLNPSFVFSEAVVEESSGSFIKLEGEVLEVEELKDPKGAAVYTVKDLSTGNTIRLFADPYRSLIQMGDEVKSAGDVLGGSKVTFIYRKSPDQDTPEIIFAKVTSSYYA
ncbi:MAG: hypothetical protein HY585_00740 [Candidatus Omnitrophica bacterium]|nr:hypothetical protein [Candidatus Omnitrophota bacterium]